MFGFQALIGPQNPNLSPKPYNLNPEPLNPKPYHASLENGILDWSHVPRTCLGLRLQTWQASAKNNP